MSGLDAPEVPPIAVHLELPTWGSNNAYATVEVDGNYTAPALRFTGAAGAGVEVDLVRFPRSGFVLDATVRGGTRSWEDPDSHVTEVRMRVVPEWQGANPPDAGAKLHVQGGVGLGAVFADVDGARGVGQAGLVGTFGVGAWLSPRTRVSFVGEGWWADGGGSSERRVDEGELRVSWWGSGAWIVARVGWLAHP